MSGELYLGGIPNPKLVGAAGGRPPAKSMVDADAVSAVCAMLGQKQRYTDAGGTQHEIIAADRSFEAFSWVESRARRDGKTVSVVFELKVQIGSKIWLQMELPTYNPYFGCCVGYLRWHERRVVVIYREKSHTLLGAFAPGQTRLRVIGDSWDVRDDLILYRSKEVGLFEVVRIPDLVTLTPVPTLMLRGDQVPKLALPASPLEFQTTVRQAYFGEFARQPDADFLVGAFSYRFWKPSGETSADYRFPPQTNAPGGLPYEWYSSQPDRLAALMTRQQNPSGGLTAVALCCFYLFVRMSELERQQSASPHGFWDPSSLRLFEADRGAFLPGFHQVVEALRHRRT